MYFSHKLIERIRVDKDHLSRPTILPYHIQLALLHIVTGKPRAQADQRIDGLHLLRGELARRPGADMQACPLKGAAT